MQKLENIKLIACDFDQTLFLPELPFPENTMQYISELHLSGIKFAIVSGRPPEDMKSLLEDKGIKWAKPFPDFLICIEKYIYDPYGNHLNEKAQVWNKKAKEHTENISSEMKNIIPKLTKLIEEQKIPIERVENAEIVFSQPEIADKARNIAKKFADRNLKSKNFLISGNLYSINISPSWPTKGDTLKFLAEEILGLQANQVIAIGDHINDLPMLDGSRGFVSATVGNAHPDVKAAVKSAGGVISPKVGPEGVGAILKMIAKQHN